MKIAVIEHRLQDDVMSDARVLADASLRASEAGAEVVLMPAVLPVDAREANDEYSRLVAGIPGTRLVPRIAPESRSLVTAVTTEVPVIGQRLGPVGFLHGDACVDAAVLRSVARSKPAVLVLAPGSESDLQAEALLELAVGLSESVAGLVILAEASGAADGEPGHGGSAIVLLGKVMAEALEGDDLLLADVPEPIPAPAPPEPFPDIPVILQQRLANHQGRKPEVSYLADLT